MIPFAVQGWQVLSGEVRPARVLDLRTAERFARGHLPGAVHLPYERVQVEEIEAGTGVLLVDAEGARAAEMAAWLRARGLPAGYLEGGMAAWTGPLEKG